MNNEKLAKTSRVLDRILKILQGFLVAGIIVSLIFVVLTAVFGEKVIADASTVELGSLSIRMNGELADYLDLLAARKSIIVSLLAAAVGCAAGWYCVRLLREILLPMKEGRPFEAGVASKICKFAWAVLIGGFIMEIGRAVSTVLMLKAYDLSMLLDNPGVASASFNYTIRPWFVVTALILFFLAHIFRCGEELQRESDETL